MWFELERILDEFSRLKQQEIGDYEKYSIISIVWHSGIPQKLKVVL